MATAPYEGSKGELGEAQLVAIVAEFGFWALDPGIASATGLVSDLAVGSG